MSIEWFDIKETPIDTNDEILISYINSECKKTFFTTTNSKENLSTYAGEVITHWAYINKPVKKRWIPKPYTPYWFINCDGEVYCDSWGDSLGESEGRRNFLGVSKTSEEAVEMRDWIKNQINSKIGEV